MELQPGELSGSRASEDKLGADEALLAEIEQPKEPCQGVFRFSDLPQELMDLVFDHLATSTIALEHNDANAGRGVSWDALVVLSVCRTFKHEMLGRLRVGVAAEMRSLRNS
ncbi:hypothetical protein LTR95_016177 [Oleoguttula sp. CCFEE 5521]